MEKNGKRFVETLWKTDEAFLRFELVAFDFRAGRFKQVSNTNFTFPKLVNLFSNSQKFLTKKARVIDACTVGKIELLYAALASSSFAPSA